MARFNPLQNSFTNGVLTKRLAVRNDLQQVNSGLRQGLNGIILPHGGFMRRPGTVFVAEAKNRLANTALIPFETSIEQPYVLELGMTSAGVGYIRFFANQGVVESSPGVPLEIATVFDDPQNIRWAQDADAMWLVHKDKYPYLLQRTAFASFTLTKADTLWHMGANNGFAPCRPTNISATTITVSGSGPFTLTASSAIFSTTNDVNRVVKLDDTTWYTITSVASTTVATATRSTGSAVGPTTNWALGLFSDTEGPRAVSFHQGRLWFGGASNAPDWLVGSVSNDYTNFDRGTTTGSLPTATNDDRSIGKRMTSSKVNTIYWIAGFGQIMAVGGSSSEFRITGANDVLTPTGTIVRAATDTGSAYSPAVVVGNSALFIQRARRGVYEIKYDVLRDQINARDLFLFSEDRFDASASGLKGCQRIAYQQIPDSVIWCVHGAGYPVSLTYNPDQQVFGACDHDIGGTVLDVAAIPNFDQSADTPWFVADYAINGVTRRYITYMADYYRPAGINRRSSIQDRINALNTAYFPDCGLNTTFGSPQTVVSGLSYLEGRQVYVLVDGATHPPVTVSGGSISLVRAGTHIVVGLFTGFRGETERFVGGAKLGTDIAQMTNVNRVGIVLMNTLDGKFGIGNGLTNKIDTLNFRTGNSNMDQSPPLFTGEMDIAVDGRWGDEPTVYWEAVDILPMTVLAVTPRAKVGER